MYKVTIWQNINHKSDRRFFSNKKDAIKWGKSNEREIEWDFESTDTYTYELESIPTPKTKREWLIFLNRHGSIDFQ
tara:strand:- start:465 stop:692 length:228 start_codon:yes stop_codon:yes gene_type:complete